MKEFSVVIEVIPLRTMRKSSYKFMTHDYFTYQPSLQTSSAGTLFICDFDVYIDRPSKSDMEDFSILRSCKVKFTDSAGNPIQIGSEDLPAKVIISPHLNTALFRIQCSMTNSPLL